MNFLSIQISRTNNSFDCKYLCGSGGVRVFGRPFARLYLLGERFLICSGGFHRFSTQKYLQISVFLQQNDKIKVANTQSNNFHHVGAFCVWLSYGRLPCWCLRFVRESKFREIFHYTFCLPKNESVVFNPKSFSSTFLSTKTLYTLRLYI